MRESIIQQQIIGYLSHIAIRNNIIFFSIPNEALMMILKVFKIENITSYKILSYLKKMGLTSGIPDLFLGYNGIGYFLEVKQPGEDPSTTQKLIHKALKRCGFEVYVVRSVEDVEFMIDDILER